MRRVRSGRVGKQFVQTRRGVTGDHSGRGAVHRGDAERSPARDQGGGLVGTGGDRHHAAAPGQFASRSPARAARRPAHRRPGSAHRRRRQRRSRPASARRPPTARPQRTATTRRAPRARPRKPAAPRRRGPAPVRQARPAARPQWTSPRTRRARRRTPAAATGTPVRCPAARCHAGPLRALTGEHEHHTTAAEVPGPVDQAGRVPAGGQGGQPRSQRAGVATKDDGAVLQRGPAGDERVRHLRRVHIGRSTG